jgi:hypothetical protein
LILLSLINVVCICVAVGVAALTSYPLYWGLLAGWLCPSVVLMLMILSYIVIDRLAMEAHHHRNHPSVVPGREQSLIAHRVLLPVSYERNDTLLHRTRNPPDVSR